jgi:hypothetical protein
MFRKDSNEEINDELKAWTYMANCDFCRYVLESVRGKAQLDSLAHPQSPTLHFNIKQFGVVSRVFLDKPRIYRFGSRLRVGEGVYEKDSELSHELQLLLNSPINSSKALLYGRAMGPIVDFNLLKSWLGSCTERHGSQCTPKINCTRKGNFTLRVVDVVRRCIIEAPPACRYLALSYVWGRARQVKLCKANRHILAQDSSLADTNTEIPATIMDALTLCENLGQRYLWVDVLCIMQDDPADKQSQIANMDIIYQAATMTIVNAAARDANGALPGIRCGTRLGQNMKVVQGLMLASPHPDFNTCLATSPWQTRGWTFQERILSHRLLIFTEHQVFFHCRSETWWEDTKLEVLDPFVNLDLANGGWRHELIHGIYSERKKLLWSGYGRPEEVTELERYAALIHSYTSRELTNEDDSLNAIQGILRDFGSTIDGQDNRFIYGLPCAAFDHALWWDNKYVPSMSKRRKGFPSWSWAGWSGKASYSGSGNGSTCFSNRKFRLSSSHCDIFFFGPENDDKVYDCVMHIGDQDIDYRPPWKPDRASVMPINIQNIHPLTAPHILRFWTSSAFLPVEYQENEPGTGCFLIPLHEGYFDKTIVLDAAWRVQQPSRLEFIVIAQELHIRSVLLTICIEWKGEVAYRVGRPSGYIYEDDWMKHNPMWRFIALG